MFSIICPKVYRRLRERTDMSQDKYGKEIGASRNTVYNFETGKSRPDAAQEARMLEVSGCSKLEFVEISCSEHSPLIGMPVGIRRSQGGYEPVFTLDDADMVLRQRSFEMRPEVFQALDRKSKIIRLMGLIFDFNYTDLEELVRACHAEIERDRNGRK